MLHRILSIVGLGVLTLPLIAAEPAIDAAQLPRVPPTPPEKALATFRLRPGFRLELVAAEPLVVDPIALSFDEDGRLYVVEMRDYSERRPERLGRIRRLEDLDGDGRFDRSTVFAEDLPWPTAVFCYGGGVFVGCTPDILWMKDTTGDGAADEREVIFTGFAADYAPFATNKLNVQALMNSFNWSLDNRIHGATSFSGGKVRPVDSPFVRTWRETGGPGAKKPARAGVKNARGSDTVLDLRGRDFSFDPRTLEMRAESGGGQHGLSFGNDGRKFVCSNSSHLQTEMYEERYAALNPRYAWPRALVEIAVDGGAAPVFRISPDEPWRVIRTQWRVAGLVPGPVEGGGRPSGYFTGATGVTIYRGDAYGEAYVGDAFIGDAGGNLVHHKKILLNGAGVRGIRPADEQRTEFLASTDNWFRPVQFANAPDGCLYICDMYREIIEHPWSLPVSLKQHLDLNSGNDRGRIYRIVPERFNQPSLPRLSRASGRTLAATLASRNGWSRDTAARLLYERQDTSGASRMRTLARRSMSPVTRLQALAALAGIDELEPNDVVRALKDYAPMVRCGALRLAERWLKQEGGEKSISLAVRALAVDPDASVRQQLGFTVRFLPREIRAETAAVLLGTRAGAEGEFALLSSISEEAGGIFARLANRDTSLLQPGLVGLSGIIGARHDRSEVKNVLQASAKALSRPNVAVTNALAGLSIVDALALGLEQAGESLRAFESERELDPIFALARQWARAYDIGNDARTDPPEARPRAISVLGAARDDESVNTLLDVVENQPQDAGRALVSLGRTPGDGVAGQLLQRWRRLTPEARRGVVALLLVRVERARALVAAMENGTVKTTELSAAQQMLLREHRDPALREKAKQVLGQATTGSRQAVIDSYRLALDLKGSAFRGRITFQQRCATCHRIGDDGFAVGPDLVTVRNGGREKLLTNLVDPNREMNGNFLGYSIETRDGDNLVGIIAGEGATSVTLRLPGGTESIVPRNRIVTLQGLERSLMPEGLEAGLGQQDMADLLEYLMAGP